MYLITMLNYDLCVLQLYLLRGEVSSIICECRQLLLGESLKERDMLVLWNTTDGCYGNTVCSVYY